MGSVRDIDIEGPMTFIRFEEMSDLKKCQKSEAFIQLPVRELCAA